MVSTALAAAGGALAGSIVTGIVSYYNNQIQQKRQDTRERAGYYIERKVKILTKLHERFAECHAILTPYIDHDEMKMDVDTLDQTITTDQLKEANDLTREIRTLIIKSQLYLTDGQKATLQVGLMTLDYALSEAGSECLERDSVLKEFQQEAQTSVGVFTDDVSLSNYYENIYSALHTIKQEVNEPIEAVRQ